MKTPCPVSAWDRSLSRPFNPACDKGFQNYISVKWRDATNLGTTTMLKNGHRLSKVRPAAKAGWLEPPGAARPL